MMNPSSKLLNWAPSRREGHDTRGSAGRGLRTCTSIILPAWPRASRLTLALSKSDTVDLPTRRYREREDRRRRLLGQILALLTVIWGIGYLIWHASVINWEAWYVSIPFFGAELLTFVLALVKRRRLSTSV